MYSLANMTDKKNPLNILANNFCFIGRCKDFCTQAHAVCGSPFLLEGSLSAYLPNRSLRKNANSFKNPYAGSYNYRVKVSSTLIARCISKLRHRDEITKNNFRKFKVINKSIIIYGL